MHPLLQIDIGKVAVVEFVDNVAYGELAPHRKLFQYTARSPALLLARITSAVDASSSIDNFGHT